MKTDSFLPFNLQRFSEGGDAPELTPEKFAELQENYKKLEKQFTKVSQEKSELEKQYEPLKAWGEFDTFVRQNPTLAKQLEEVVSNYSDGNVSQADLNKVSKAIAKAEDKGDDKLVKRLEALEAQLESAQVEKTLSELEKRAQNEGLDGFSQDGFHEFSEKWFKDELELGDDDDITPRHLKLAYTAYKAHLLEENTKRGKVPKLGTQSAGVQGASKKDDKPTPKERLKAAREFLLRQ